MLDFVLHRHQKQNASRLFKLQLDEYEENARVRKGNVLWNPFLLSGELREYEMSAAVRRLIGVHRWTLSVVGKETDPLCRYVMKQNYLSSKNISELSEKTDI